ncbi:MAG: hypothetical protein HC883_03810 [Bdellovibrionaceae bacterium]|nr:hypothetical protein [Pseudobdellovibrionaceae bacterium]
MNKILAQKLLLVAAISLTLFFQNCGQFLSNDDRANRHKIVSSKVFMSTQAVEEDALGQILALGGNNNEARGTVTQLADCLAAGECDSNGEILVLRAPRSFEQPRYQYGPRSSLTLSLRFMLNPMLAVC